MGPSALEMDEGPVGAAAPPTMRFLRVHRS